MDRLVLIMAHCRMINVRDFVEREFAVKTKIGVTLFQLVAVITVRRKLLHLFVTGYSMISIKETPGSAAQKKLQPGIDQRQPATMSEARVKVSDFVQLGHYPALFKEIF